MGLVQDAALLTVLRIDRTVKGGKGVGLVQDAALLTVLRID